MWSIEVPKTTRNQEKARNNASKATKNKRFMKMGHQKYMDYWKNTMSKCEGFATTFGPYVDYWACVLVELEKPLPISLP
jgi:hypothetical protein